MARVPEIPDPTAVRVALWRALHPEVDGPPLILQDTIGLRLAAPAANWRERPDMHPEGTRGYRAWIVARARFVEDLVEERVAQGVRQYVILGAGLDTFAQRRAEFAERFGLHVFEIDQPATQAWKRERLSLLGYGVPPWLHLVPVDFERQVSWIDSLAAGSFDLRRPCVAVSTGVSMYLTHEAIRATLQQAARLAPGSLFVMTFMLPLELLAEGERPQHRAVHERAKAAGTPFLSFFRPEEMLALAQEAGFRGAECVSSPEIIARYFAGRTDGLRPAHGEVFLVART